MSETHDNTRTEPRLCYIDGGCAYFTTQPITQQWGDDWNDAPYEHNAGDPYTYSTHNAARDEAPWEIHCRYYTAQMSTPEDDASYNSRYCVQTINTGTVAWLRSWKQGATREDHVWAGDTITEFTRKVQAAGGTVYAPVVAL